MAIVILILFTNFNNFTDSKVSTLQRELSTLRKLHVKNHNMFAIRLCSFDPIDPKIANIENRRTLKFVGKPNDFDTFWWNVQEQMNIPIPFLNMDIMSNWIEIKGKCVRPSYRIWVILKNLRIHSTTVFIQLLEEKDWIKPMFFYISPIIIFIYYWLIFIRHSFDFDTFRLWASSSLFIFWWYL